MFSYTPQNSEGGRGVLSFSYVFCPIGTVVFCPMVRRSVQSVFSRCSPLPALTVLVDIESMSKIYSMTMFSIGESALNFSYRITYYRLTKLTI